MASEDEARGVGLNWASEGLGFVHISVVDFAWKLLLLLVPVPVLVGESMSMAMAETEAEREVEMEEHRERGQEGEDEVGELEDEVWRPMRGKERRVVRRREDEQEE